MKNARGRPPKKNSADSVIPPIRVTEDQKHQYQEAAKSAGLSLSEWIRGLADKAAHNSQYVKRVSE